MRKAACLAGACRNRQFTLALAALVLSLSTAGAHKLPQPGALAFKDVPEHNIIYIVHSGPQHIASSFAKLVAYYLKDATPYTVVFPQMTMQVSDTETWVAVAYTGSATAADEINVGSLPASRVASKVCRGSYEKLNQVIRAAYQEIAATKQYIPQENAPLRLLYWNSPDDNRPEDLITEIQIPVTRIP